jgi:serine/threonine protein phosphatase 1
LTKHLPEKQRGFFARLLGKEREAATVPEGIRVYAVGDIHGRADLLDRLTNEIIFDSSEWRRAGGRCVVVYLGDYVDRGPDSFGVIDALLNPPSAFEPIFLLGNHDQVVLDFLNDASVYRVWREFGAMETLLSYAVRPPRFDDDGAFEKTREEFEKALPASHLKFLHGLQHYAEIGGYYFAHAGVRPGVALKDQAVADLLWIRGEFLDSSADFGAVVVHGHSPTEEPVVRANRIGVDTGAYVTGRLTAVVLEGAEHRFLHT